MTKRTDELEKEIKELEIALNNSPNNEKYGLTTEILLSKARLDERRKAEEEIKKKVEILLSKKLGKNTIATTIEGKEMLVFYKKDFEGVFKE